MDANSPIEHSTTSRTAADWLVLLDGRSVDGATSAAFLTWLEAEPENASDYELCEAILTVATQLGRSGEIAAAPYRDGAVDVPAELLATVRSALKWATRPGSRTLLVAAAISAVVFGPMSLVGTGSRDAASDSPIDAPSGTDVGASIDAPPAAATEAPTAVAHTATGPLGDTPSPAANELGPSRVELPRRPAANPAGEPVAPAAADAAAPAAEASARESAGSFGADAGACSSLARLADELADTEARIRDLTVRTNRLLLQYTERHPDIIAARAQLETLTEQRQQLRQQLDARRQSRVPSACSNVE